MLIPAMRVHSYCRAEDVLDCILDEKHHKAKLESIVRSESSLAKTFLRYIDKAKQAVNLEDEKLVEAVLDILSDNITRQTILTLAQYIPVPVTIGRKSYYLLGSTRKYLDYSIFDLQTLALGILSRNRSKVNIDPDRKIISIAGKTRSVRLEAVLSVALAIGDLTAYSKLMEEYLAKTHRLIHKYASVGKTTTHNIGNWRLDITINPSTDASQPTAVSCEVKLSYAAKQVYSTTLNAYGCEALLRSLLVENGISALEQYIVEAINRGLPITSSDASISIVLDKHVLMEYEIYNNIVTLHYITSRNIKKLKKAIDILMEKLKLEVYYEAHPRYGEIIVRMPPSGLQSLHTVVNSITSALERASEALKDEHVKRHESVLPRVVNAARMDDPETILTLYKEGKIEVRSSGVFVREDNGELKEIPYSDRDVEAYVYVTLVEAGLLEASEDMLANAFSVLIGSYAPWRYKSWEKLSVKKKRFVIGGASRRALYEMPLRTPPRDMETVVILVNTLASYSTSEATALAVKLAGEMLGSDYRVEWIDERNAVLRVGDARAVVNRLPTPLTKDAYKEFIVIRPPMDAAVAVSARSVEEAVELAYTMYNIMTLASYASNITKESTRKIPFEAAFVNSLGDTARWLYIEATK